MNVNGVTGGAPAAAGQPRPGATMGKDQFLQLLVTQLRHQDPMNPADPKDFAAQLAQFSTLEQLINLGDQLKIMTAADRVMIELLNGNSAVSVLGRDVLAPGDEMDFDPDNPGALTVDVQTAGRGQLRVFDMNGKEVLSQNVGELAAGRQSIDLSELDLPAGHYRYSVDVSGDGGTTPARTYIHATVTGVHYTDQGPMLRCGRINVPLSAVIEVTVPKPAATTTRTPDGENNP